MSRAIALAAASLSLAVAGVLARWRGRRERQPHLWVLDTDLGYDPDDDSDFGGGDGGFVVDEFDQSQEPVQLASGLRVVHPVYGFGTVVRSQGHGLQAKATVRFDRGGEKTLILEYAGLRAVPGQEAT